MFKKILVGLISVIAVGSIAYLIYAYEPAIKPIARPAAKSFPASLVAKGALLASGGYCASCHTAGPSGAAYAGGNKMTTHWGTIYSTNITPDTETGIGNWSEEAFKRAMQQGIRRNGQHLFPAFPYDHFSLLQDDDIKALYAYCMSLPPVRQANQAAELFFPLNLRVWQAGWKWLFFHPDEYRPKISKGAQWDRGAYLAEALSHCSSCHSPRNLWGAEQVGAQRYTGELIDGWFASALTPRNQAPISWTENALYNYLRTGNSVWHGSATGPMSPVIHQGLNQLPDADIRAIALYIADWLQTDQRPSEPKQAIKTPQQTNETLHKNQQVIAKVMQVNLQSIDENTPGARLYQATCAACHYNQDRVISTRPELGFNYALIADEPNNLILAMLKGVSLAEGMPNIMMPGFAKSLNDHEIATLAAWLRRTRTPLAPWPNLEQTVTQLRQQAKE